MTRITGEFSESIREIAAAIERGGVIGVGTDTTYALVTGISSKTGVERLREMRKIPPSKNLSLLMPDLTEISRWAFVDRAAYRMMKRLTPGRYTFILRATKEIPRVTLTNQRTVGIRICDKPIVVALCRSLASPLISASAAVGEGYASTAEEFASAYPGLELIIDSGTIRPEVSTIIDLTGAEPVTLREGK